MHGRWHGLRGRQTRLCWLVFAAAIAAPTVTRVGLARKQARNFAFNPITFCDQAEWIRPSAHCGVWWVAPLFGPGVSLSLLTRYSGLARQACRQASLWTVLYPQRYIWETHSWPTEWSLQRLGVRRLDQTACEKSRSLGKAGPCGAFLFPTYPKVRCGAVIIDAPFAHLFLTRSLGCSILAACASRQGVQRAKMSQNGSSAVLVEFSAVVTQTRAPPRQARLSCLSPPPHSSRQQHHQTDRQHVFSLEGDDDETVPCAATLQAGLRPACDGRTARLFKPAGR